MLFESSVRILSSILHVSMQVGNLIRFGHVLHGLLVICPILKSKSLLSLFI
jgi:hypothetical protein